MENCLRHIASLSSYSIGISVFCVVDPGTKPDRKRRGGWLAYINSACYLWQQNIVTVQYRGAIWYRVCQPIAPGDELLTHYGEERIGLIQLLTSVHLTQFNFMLPIYGFSPQG